MSGFLFLMSAYLIWCIFPFYFKQMDEVNPLDIMAFRTFFTAVSMVPAAFACGQGRLFFGQFRSCRRLLFWLASGLLIGINWLVFVILVNTENTLQASLGYYINPLITVCFSLLFFKERFGKLQWSSICVAAIGVTVFAVGTGTLPLGAFCLAITFGLYGVMKKISPIDPLTSLAAETLLLLPFVVPYIVCTTGVTRVWAINPIHFVLLFGAGVMTGISLILYGAGAQRCKLSTLGLCQYITPTGQFLTAVLLFREPMQMTQWFCFFLIWLALFLFTLDSLRFKKQRQSRIAESTEDAGKINDNVF